MDDLLILPVRGGAASGDAKRLGIESSKQGRDGKCSISSSDLFEGRE